MRGQADSGNYCTVKCALVHFYMQSQPLSAYVSLTVATFPTTISNGADYLLSAYLAFPLPDQDSGGLAKRDSDMPTTVTARVADTPYSPNSWPFTPIIFCTTLPDSKKNQSFILSGTYTLPWITVTHIQTPAPSSSSGACVIHSNLNFLFITSLLFGIYW